MCLLLLIALLIVVALVVRSVWAEGGRVGCDREGGCVENNRAGSVWAGGQVWWAEAGRGGCGQGVGV